jgi:hypothetical protein
MKKLLFLVLSLALLLTATAFADSFSIVTTRPTTGTTLDWLQFGPPFTTLPSPTSWTAGAFTGTASDSGTMERRDEGNGWVGIFTPGDHLLWNQDNGNALDIHFNTPIGIGGAQIQDDFFGLFMGCVQALGSFGASPVFCVSGNNTGAEDGSAPFIGIQDLSGANITDLLFTTDVGPNATAINQLTFSGGAQTTPEPGSMMLLGSGLVSIFGLAKRRFFN